MGREPDTVLTGKQIVVLGGGLAGLSAARRLQEHGAGVTLVEKRPFLGGRAFSFRDPQEAVEVDNGQHVFLGCCNYYIDFLKAVNALDKAYLQPALRTEVVRNGVRGVLSSVPGLGRLHLLPSLVRYPHLGLVDKLLALYGLVSVKLTSRRRRSSALDNESAYDWLKRHRQTDRAIANLWNLFLLPALNDDVRDVSADMALKVFQEALLKGPSDAAIGLARVGLTSLNGEPARRHLESNGGKVLLGKTVKEVNADDGHISGLLLSTGERLSADAYVSALPFSALTEILPGELAADPFFSAASGLSSSPIVGIHLWYDRRVMDQEFVAFLDSPVQWVFNKSLIQGCDGEGQYLCISLSGAWRYVDIPKDELKSSFVREMEELFPRARGARVLRCLVVKERQATFRSSPGAARHRLPQRTPVPNLFLAGEWTDTDWPSTMEGAVRSGVFAADALASRLGQTER